MIFDCFTVSSPHKVGSVFVLCSVQMEPSGTAFIVSPTRVLTAYHNIADDPQKPTKKHTKKWLLAERVERLRDGRLVPIGSTIPVEADNFSSSTDFVFLHRIDGLQFRADEILHICPKAMLPPWNSPIGLNLNAYHCPIQLFNAKEGMDAVHAVSVNVKRTIVSKHKCWIDQGLYAGSSGAPYVIANHGPTFGMVYGMHVESINAVKSLSDFEEDERGSQEVLSEVTDSFVESYGAFGRAIIVSSYKTLTDHLA